ncbi:hypothetical protein BS629_06150 [Rhizobium leguminosarum bv. viciae USDA 2370]|nr:hypothetical protein BS629_06150 [Rhizobium leguminosarum bv. viciae USDA 2370]
MADVVRRNTTGVDGTHRAAAGGPTPTARAPPSRNGSEGDRVRSVGSLQHFVSIFSAVRNLFLPSQTNRSAAQIRTHRRQAMAAWEAVSARPA